MNVFKPKNFDVIKKTSILRYLLFCSLGFFIGRLFIFPGFLDITSPSHSDLYRYFVISQTDLSRNIWMLPRPLMYVWLWIMGKFTDSPYILWGFISLIPIGFLSVFVYVVSKFLQFKVNSLQIFLYSAIVFSMPVSWEIYQLDFGGLLSGLICSVSVYYFFLYKRNIFSYLIALLLFWISLEFKPTFSILACMLSLFYLYFKKSSYSAILFTSIVGTCFIVFLKDKIIGSEFVSSDSGDVYEVSLNFTKNIFAVAKYYSAVLTPNFIPGLALLYLYCFLNKKINVFCLLMLLCSMAAIAPMALIPNRVMDLYSWYIIIFLFAPILVINNSRINIFPHYQKYITAVILLFILFGSFTHSKFLPGKTAWIISINEYNSNVMKSLDILKTFSPQLNGRKILVSGLKGPYHAFKNEAFIELVSKFDKYTILLRKSERDWNNMSKEMADGSYLDEVELMSFDYYIIYAKDGTIKYILSRYDLEQTPAWWRPAVIFLASNRIAESIKNEDYYNAINDFIKEEEASQASSLQYNLRANKIINPSVVSWGPDNTIVNEHFNIQPNGCSAMWININGIFPNINNYIMIGNKKITDIVYNNNGITFLVPSDVYSDVGSLDVNLYDAVAMKFIHIGSFDVRNK